MFVTPQVWIRLVLTGHGPGPKPMSRYDQVKSDLPMTWISQALKFDCERSLVSGDVLFEVSLC